MRVYGVVERGRHLVVDVELQQAIVEHVGDGRDTDLAGLLWVHRLQLHPALKLMVFRTLETVQRNNDVCKYVIK